MAETSKLVERYVVDEFKIQVTELNSNPYLGIYGVVLGIVVGKTEKILQSVKTFTLGSPFQLSSVIVLMFAVIVVTALFSILVQSARVYNRDVHRFQLDQEVMSLAAEERAKLMSEYAENEFVDKLDEKVSEAVRLRITNRMIDINRKYRKLNRQKASAQRVTAVCLFTIAVMIFYVSIYPTIPSH